MRRIEDALSIVRPSSVKLSQRAELASRSAVEADLVHAEASDVNKCRDDLFNRDWERKRRAK
jgi:hypothetical protein